MAVAKQTLFVPVKDGPQHVELRLDALPDDVEVVLQLLQGEVAPPAMWIDVAVSRRRQGGTVPRRRTHRAECVPWEKRPLSQTEHGSKRMASVADVPKGSGC